MTPPVVRAEPESQRGWKSEMAYQRIRAQILDGTHSPGDRLVLDRLATDIGVSAVPVREALRRLEAEGYVDFRPNQGATVSSIDASAYGETMEALATLEGTATGLSAPLLTKKDLSAARRVNNAMTVSLERFDIEAFSEGNQEFHEILYRLCPNTYLLRLIDREWDRIRSIRDSRFAFVPDRARQAVVEHAQLITLIESGASGVKVDDYVRKHRMRTARRFLDR